MSAANDRRRRALDLTVWAVGVGFLCVLLALRAEAMPAGAAPDFATPTRIR